MSIIPPSDISGVCNQSHRLRLYAGKPPGGFLKIPNAVPWTPGVDLLCTDRHEFVWTPEEKLALEYMSMRKSGQIDPKYIGVSKYDKIISNLQNFHIGQGISPYHLLRFMIPKEIKTLLSVRSLAIHPAAAKYMEKQQLANVALLAAILEGIDTYLKMGSEEQIASALQSIDAYQNLLNTLSHGCPGILDDQSRQESLIKVQDYIGTLKYALENRDTAFVRMITPNKSTPKDALQRQRRYDFFQTIVETWISNCRALNETTKSTLVDLKSNNVNIEELGLTSKLTTRQKNALRDGIRVLRVNCRKNFEERINDVSQLEAAVNVNFASPIMAEIKRMLLDPQIRLTEAAGDLRQIEEIYQRCANIHGANQQQVQKLNQMTYKYQNALEALLHTEGLNVGDQGILRRALEATVGRVYTSQNCLSTSLLRGHVTISSNFLQGALCTRKSDCKGIIHLFNIIESRFPALKSPPIKSSWISPLEQLLASVLQAINGLENSSCVGAKQKERLYLFAHLAFVIMAQPRLDGKEGYLCAQMIACLDEIRIQNNGARESYHQALTDMQTMREFQRSLDGVRKEFISMGVDPSVILTYYWRHYYTPEIAVAKGLWITSMTSGERQFIYQAFSRMTYFIGKLEKDTKSLVEAIPEIKATIAESVSLADPSDEEHMAHFKANFDVEGCFALLDQIALEISEHHREVAGVLRGIKSGGKTFTTYPQLVKDLRIWEGIISKLRNWGVSLSAPGNLYAPQGTQGRLLEMFKAPIQVAVCVSQPDKDDRDCYYMPEIVGEISRRADDILCPYESMFPILETPIKRLANYQNLVVEAKPVKKRRKAIRPARSTTVAAAPQKSLASNEEAPACSSLASLQEVLSEMQPVEMLAIIPCMDATAGLRDVIARLDFSSTPAYCQEYARQCQSNMNAHMEGLNELFKSPLPLPYAVNQQLVNKAGLIFEMSLKLALAYPPFKAEADKHPLWMVRPDGGRLKNSHDLPVLVRETDSFLKSSGGSSEWPVNADIRQLVKDLNQAVPRFSRYPGNHAFNPVSSRLMNIFDYQQDLSLIDEDDYMQAQTHCRRWAEMAIKAAMDVLQPLVRFEGRSRHTVEALDATPPRNFMPEGAIIMDALTLETTLKEVHENFKAADCLLANPEDKSINRAALKQALTNYNALRVSLSALAPLLKMPRHQQRQHVLAHTDSALLQASLSVEQLLLATISLLEVRDDMQGGELLLAGKTVEFAGRPRLLRNTHWLERFLSIVVEHAPDERKEALARFTDTAKLLELYLG